MDNVDLVSKVKRIQIHEGKGKENKILIDITQLARPRLGGRHTVHSDTVNHRPPGLVFIVPAGDDENLVSAASQRVGMPFYPNVNRIRIVDDKADLFHAVSQKTGDAWITAEP